MASQPSAKEPFTRAPAIATIILIVLGSLVTSIQAGLYLPKRDYHFFIDDTPSLTPGQVLGVIPLAEHAVFQCDVQGYASPLRSPSYVTVRLDSSKVLILVGPNSIPDSIRSANGLSFEVALKCRVSGGEYPLPYYAPLTRARVTLQLIPPGIARLKALGSQDGGGGNGLAGGDATQELTDAICPPGGRLDYNVVENTQTGSTLEVLNPGSWLGDAAVADFEFKAQSAVDSLAMNKDASGTVLTLAQSPDREERQTLSAIITCRVKVKGHTDEVIKDVEVQVTVYDVDDEAPSVHYTDLEILKEIEVKRTDTHKSLTFRDKDSPSVTNMNTYVLSSNDTSGAIGIGDIQPLADSLYSLELKFSLMKVKLPFVADVYVKDATLSPVPRTVTFRIKVPGAAEPPMSPVQSEQPAKPAVRTPSTLPITLKANVDKSATTFTVIENVADKVDKEGRNFTYRLLRSDIPGLVEITPSGQLYLVKPNLMWGFTAQKSAFVDIGQLDVGQEIHQISVILTITNEEWQNDFLLCGESCSTYNATTCENETSCGLGAPLGKCSWGPPSNQLMTSPSASSSPDTCSPNLLTCPDGVCDDLERMHWAICPQDCSAGQRNASGSLPLPTRIGPAHKSRSSGGCSHACRVTLATIAAAVTLVYVIVLVTWLIYRRRRKERCHLHSLKRSTSLASVGAVPSDYIVDDSLSRSEVRSHPAHVTHRQVTTSSSPSSGHWGSSETAQNVEIFDDNWEFPRSNLTLDHVLGEGEFGQVVMAKAFNLKGQGLNTIVAVKMLKPEASGTEYQDLASEFQLLKEVDHPNVIRLLGVCSQKGPLYLIVEYCELGSLRSFLRASKFKNKGSWEDKKRIAEDDENSQAVEERVITYRDLFSFAWQIAKGMDYLAGLKIVHRDLAARNVLVSDGLKLKISDFGLSRDVYEMDTYLKMSKGRIPVKWMAPESLYGQVYTTKSDMCLHNLFCNLLTLLSWSYGIVLWETVTLGASPYPGIPPESLFPLLNTGYRMDRPEDCPDELYAIMQKCWKKEPEQRPTFASLVSTLDNILQQNTVYLDLSGDNYMSQPSSYGTNTNKQEPSASSPAVPVTPENNNHESKPYALDNKVNQYSNLQPLNSSPTLTPDERSKVKPNRSPYEIQSEEDQGESEAETEMSSHLLNPGQGQKRGSPAIIFTSGSTGLRTPIGNEPKQTTSRYKDNQNHGGAGTQRRNVHENLTYV